MAANCAVPFKKKPVKSAVRPEYGMVRCSHHYKPLGTAYVSQTTLPRLYPNVLPLLTLFQSLCMCLFKSDCYHISKYGMYEDVNVSLSQVNVFFLFVALATVFRTTRSKAQRSRKIKGYGELFKYVVVMYVHLPQYIISNTFHWMRGVRRTYTNMHYLGYTISGNFSLI